MVKQNDLKKSIITVGVTGTKSNNKISKDVEYLSNMINRFSLIDKYRAQYPATSLCTFFKDNIYNLFYIDP